MNTHGDGAYSRARVCSPSRCTSLRFHAERSRVHGRPNEVPSGGALWRWCQRFKVVLVAWQDIPDDAEVNARDTKGERSSMRARAPEYLTRRSSCGESINVTTCHQSGSALLPSASPAHPHPPLLLFLLTPNPSAALRPSNLLRSSFEGGADCSAGKARRCLHRIYDLIYNCSWHNCTKLLDGVYLLVQLHTRGTQGFPSFSSYYLMLGATISAQGRACGPQRVTPRTGVKSPRAEQRTSSHSVTRSRGKRASSAAISLRTCKKIGASAAKHCAPAGSTAHNRTRR